MIYDGRVRERPRMFLKKLKDRESKGKILNIFCHEFSGVLVAYINSLKR